MDLYQRDSRRAAELAATLPPGQGLQQAAVRFVLEHPSVTSAIIGIRQPDHVDQAVAALADSD